MAVRDLPDVNVWMALSNRDHVHHERAADYWRLEAAPVVAYCSHTYLGLLRLLTMKALPEHQRMSPSDAHAHVVAWLSHPSVNISGEPEGTLIQLYRYVELGLVEATDWSDAYLAAFAEMGAFRLVTFDRDFARFPGLSLLHLAGHTT